MTKAQKKLFDDVLSAKEDETFNIRDRGVYLFGGRIRTAKSMPNMIVVRNVNSECYESYAFYKHNPLICTCKSTIHLSVNIADFCTACKGIIAD